MDRLRRGDVTLGDRPTRRLIVALSLVALVAACTSVPPMPSTSVPPPSASPAPTTSTSGTPTASTRPDANQLAAVTRLEAASTVPSEFRFEQGYVRGFVGRVPAAGGTPVDRARSFLGEHADLYGLAEPEIELQVRRHAWFTEMAHTVTFSEIYRGLPVYGGELVVRLVEGDVVGTTGALLHDYRGDIVPAFGQPDAERLARAAVGADQAAILGRTTLLILDRSLWIGGPSTARLAWRVSVGAPHIGFVFIDAKTGEVLSEDPFAQEELDPFEDMDLDLEDAENDSSAADDGCYWLSDETEVGDEDGIDSDYDDDPDAVNAWTFARNAYAFYHSNFGRHSWDGDDDEVNVYIRATVPNARYSDCEDGLNAIEFKENFIAFDITVHEYTHGVISFTSELSSSWPSNTLNEGLSDVMAAFADGDWELGEDLPAKFLDGWPASRSLEDPPSNKGYPDRWSERMTQEYPDTGITSKAAWLLTVGGQHPDTGVNVSGIGSTKARYLYYWVLQQLSSSANLFDLRDSMVATAQAFVQLDAFFSVLGWPQLGFTDNDVCQVRNAFGAVELGNIDQDCNGQVESIDWDNDTIPNNLDNCQFVANPDQTADHDGDGVGDLCDPEFLLDTDFDGVKDFQDNCDQFANPDQVDQDGDGIGFPCDQLDSPDADGDGKLNEVDNCPQDANTDQVDTDNDGDGDACDPDSDGDSFSNDNDICPFTADPGQEDSDGDGLGDACDECPTDAEDVNAWTTGIPDLGIDPQPVVPDSDGDGTPDACDGTPWGNVFMLPDLVVDAGGLDARVTGETVIEFQGGRGSVPILVCDPEPCVDAPPPEQCIGLAFVGMVFVGGVEGVGIAVTDDRGVGVGSAGAGPIRSIRFQPKGGRSYFLTVTGAPVVENVPIRLAFVPCQLEPDRPLHAAPDEPPASPSPGPTELPIVTSPTPAPTPTEEPPATPTPTPTPTQQPTPRPTPSPTPCAVPTPSPALPPAGSTVLDAQPTLIWRYPSEACPPLRQRIQLATDRTMQNLVYNERVPGAVRNWTPPAPLANCTWFYWRVIPIGSDGMPQTASQVFAFFVQTSRLC